METTEGRRESRQAARSGQAMTVPEREEFLAAVRIGVMAVARDGRPPLVVPMWYDYRPGGVITIITARHSRKAVAIRAARELSLCLHSDDPPYRYVSVSGPVLEIHDPITAEQRAMFASRYLGAEGGQRYVAERSDATADMIAISVRPECWLTQDQSR